MSRPLSTKCFLVVDAVHDDDLRLWGCQHTSRVCDHEINNRDCWETTKAERGERGRGEVRAQRTNERWKTKESTLWRHHTWKVCMTSNDVITLVAIVTVERKEQRPQTQRVFVEEDDEEEEEEEEEDTVSHDVMVAERGGKEWHFGFGGGARRVIMCWAGLFHVRSVCGRIYRWMHQSIHSGCVRILSQPTKKKTV